MAVSGLAVRHRGPARAVLGLIQACCAQKKSPQFTVSWFGWVGGWVGPVVIACVVPDRFLWQEEGDFFRCIQPLVSQKKPSLGQNFGLL